MKNTATLFLFLGCIIAGVSSCQSTEQHKHGTQEEWQHHHAISDTAHQISGNNKGVKN